MGLRPRRRAPGRRRLGAEGPHQLRVNLTQRSAQVDGESRDTIGCVIDAHTEYGNRGFDVLARFTYDPRPEGSEPHPYGFRFEAARLTPTHATPTPNEYTDLYELLDALIAGLYGEGEAKE